jgi:hypothetical protein
VRILALDPGERVGWNTATISHEPLPTPAPSLRIDDYGILPQKRCALAMFGANGWSLPGLWITNGQFDVVICESWILSAHGAKVSVGEEMLSSQFIGQVRLASWLTPYTRLVMQPPRAMNTGKLALLDDRPDYAAIRTIIEAAPKAHDDSHYVSSLLHTVRYFHRHHA